MTKNEAAWLALRITGLAVALSAIQHVAAIAYFIYIFFSGGFSDITGSISDRISLQTTLPQFLYGIAMLAAAYYLLFKGAKLQGIVMRQSKE